MDDLPLFASEDPEREQGVGDDLGLDVRCLAGGQRFVALSLSHRIQAAVPGDGEEPCAQRPPTVAVSADAFDGFQEDLPGNVFGCFPLAELGQGGAEDEVAVLFEQRGPLVRVPGAQGGELAGRFVPRDGLEEKTGAGEL